jgi:hypothetical protein
VRTKRVVFFSGGRCCSSFFGADLLCLFVGGEHFHLFFMYLYYLLSIFIFSYLHVFIQSLSFLAVSQEIGIQYMFFVIFFAAGILVMCQ